MGKWGADEFVLQMDFKAHGALFTAIQNLNAKARQAFYGAALAKGQIEQGTWNGCAFNAAGDYVGVPDIHSYEAAATTFGLTPYVVSKFIEAWDAYRPTDGRNATEHLIEMLEKVGLFKDNPSIKITTYSHRVYTSEETRMIEELRAEINNGEFLEGMTEACELLTV
jgi:hypothetical protein